MIKQYNIFVAIYYFLVDFGKVQTDRKKVMYKSTPCLYTGELNYTAATI